MNVGLISDTHGVFDPQLQQAFNHVSYILHAGDVGHHGGHEGVRLQLQEIAPTLCVRGNVDNDAPLDAYPATRLAELAGWKLLTTHICGNPPSKEVVEMAKQAQADIVLFGHSHKYSVEAIQGILYINPGSAGPARFRLKRTAAILTLPNKGSEALPSVKQIELEGKAPSRARSSFNNSRKRKAAKALQPH